MAVSTVQLNGTTLMTVNDTTSTASDVASGKYFYAADGTKTLGTASGGGYEDDILDGSLRDITNDTVTALKSNIFRDDGVIESVSFPNVITAGGYVFSGAYKLKKVNFPNLQSVTNTSFIYGCKSLIRISLPSASGAIGGNFARDAYMLTSVDFGSSVTQIQQPQSFAGLDNISEIVLRNPNNVVSLQNANIIDTNCMTLFMQKNGFVYVPNSLKSSYQIASNWSTFYGLNSDLFRSLESYTVDGTTTGALDYSKIWSAHTPDYSLSNEVFDGTKVIDTGVQLFDGGTGAFTIVFSVSGTGGTPSGQALISCLDSNGLGVRLTNNGNSAAAVMLYFYPDAVYSGALLNQGTADYIGFIRSDGLNASAVLLSTDGIFKTKQSLRRTGTVQTLSETLLIGGNYVSGTPTAQWKGTVHMMKVFKSCLNMNEIVSLLGLEA